MRRPLHWCVLPSFSSAFIINDASESFCERREEGRQGSEASNWGEEEETQEEGELLGVRLPRAQAGPS